MKLTLDSIPRKRTQLSRPGLGLPYPQAYALWQKMAAQDPSVLFYALRPLGDELWNMIDGERNIGGIIESCLIEFGFEVDPNLFLPIFEGFERDGLISRNLVHRNASFHVLSYLRRQVFTLDSRLRGNDKPSTI